LAKETRNSDSRNSMTKCYWKPGERRKEEMLWLAVPNAAK
jgi:hypothetical protein